MVADLIGFLNKRVLFSIACHDTTDDTGDVVDTTYSAAAAAAAKLQKSCRS